MHWLTQAKEVADERFDHPKRRETFPDERHGNPGSRDYYRAIDRDRLSRMGNGKNFVDNDDMPDSYYLGLQGGRTVLPRVNVDGGLYEVVFIDSPVSVKFWRGHAMIVTGGGTRSGTEYHSDRENYHDWFFVVTSCLGEGMFVHGYLSERRKRIRNSLPDVP